VEVYSLYTSIYIFEEGLLFYIQKNRLLLGGFVVSKSISGVLYLIVIYLECQLPGISSDQPGNEAGNFLVPLFGLAPDGVYRAI